MNRLQFSALLLTLATAPAGAAPKSKPTPAAKTPPVASKPLPKPAADPTAPEVISQGKEAILVDHLRPEAVTVVLFYRPANEEEQELADALRKRSAQESRLALKHVRLTAVEAPIARQYEVTETPAAFVYDRNKNLLGRARNFTEVGELVTRGLRVARLKWLNEDDPTAPTAYRAFGGGARPVPEIMKTLSLRPEIMEAINNLSRFHFSDGFLDRRAHEMIASYVSALNKCKY
jgi:hypothetical protein